MRNHRTAALAILAAAVLATSTPALAQREPRTLGADPTVGVTRVATRGLNFLELGVGARALALGGAYTASAEGLFSLYWNAAGLADLEGISAAASYQDLYENSGLTNAFIAVGVPIGAGAFGVSLTRFSSGEIQRTTERFPDGNDPSFGSTVEWIGSAVGVHYARRITDRLSFGVTGKLAEEGLDFAHARWVGADVGTVFRTGLLATTLGIAVSNLGGRSRMEGSAIERVLASNVRDPLFPTTRELPASFKTQGLQMPTIFRFGLRTDLVGAAESLLAPNPSHSIVLLSELNDAIDGPITPVLAVEYGFRNLVFLRGSKRWIREDRAPFDFGDGVAAGAGLRLPAFGRALWLDYAFQTLEPLGSSQTVSLEFSF